MDREDYMAQNLICLAPLLSKDDVVEEHQSRMVPVRCIHLSRLTLVFMKVASAIFTLVPSSCVKNSLAWSNNGRAILLDDTE